MLKMVNGFKAQNFVLQESDFSLLGKLSKKQGISMSAVLRFALRDYARRFDELA